MRLHLEGEEHIDELTTELILEVGRNHSVLGDLRSSIASVEEIMSATTELVIELGKSGRQYWWASVSERRS